MTSHTDDLYEILDDMNARIEEIVTEHEDENITLQLLAFIQQKAQDFFYELQVEIDRLEMIESDLNSFRKEA